MTTSDTRNTIHGSTSRKSGARQPQPCSILVRGGAVIADPGNPGTVIHDGAVCIHEDRIVAVGDYQELRREFVADDIYGSDRHVVMPGLVNAHDHVMAPSTLQLGIQDDVLEAWIFDLLRLPDIDPRLSSALACCQLIEAGVTTVLNSFYVSSAERYYDILAGSISGCQQTGIRAAFALSIMDDGIIATLFEKLRPQLTGDLRAWADKYSADRRPIPPAEYIDIVRHWHRELQAGRHTIMVGPVSAHWCSEALLQLVWSEAETLDVPIQTHLLESPFQREEALVRYGRSIVEYMSEADLLSPRLSCAHCVQVTDRDIDLLAGSGTSVVHNASSNLRLHNGVAPVVAMQRNGVNVCLGLDNMGINDDGDMIQEMRLVSCLHRPGSGNAGILTSHEIFQMATVNGAQALGLDDQIGTLECGRKADLIALRPDDIQVARARADDDVMDVIVSGRSKARVDTVIIDGDLVLREGRHAKIDKQELANEIAILLHRLGGKQSAADAMVSRMKPYVRRFLDTQPSTSSPDTTRQET